MQGILARQAITGPAAENQAVGNLSAKSLSAKGLSTRSLSISASLLAAAIGQGRGRNARLCPAKASAASAVAGGSTALLIKAAVPRERRLAIFGSRKSRM